MSNTGWLSFFLFYILFYPIVRDYLGGVYAELAHACGDEVLEDE